MEEAERLGLKHVSLLFASIYCDNAVTVTIKFLVNTALVVPRVLNAVSVGEKKKNN